MATRDENLAKLKELLRLHGQELPRMTSPQQGTTPLVTPPRANIGDPNSRSRLPTTFSLEREREMIMERRRQPVSTSREEFGQERLGGVRQMFEAGLRGATVTTPARTETVVPSTIVTGPVTPPAEPTTEEDIVTEFIENPGSGFAQYLALALSKEDIEIGRFNPQTGDIVDSQGAPLDERSLALFTSAQDKLERSRAIADASLKTKGAKEFALFEARLTERQTILANNLAQVREREQRAFDREQLDEVKMARIQAGQLQREQLRLAQQQLGMQMFIALASHPGLLRLLADRGLIEMFLPGINIAELVKSIQEPSGRDAGVSRTKVA